MKISLSQLRSAPNAALVLGFGGLIPFVGLAALSWAAPAREPWVWLLTGYGAIIVTFVAALHWGYAVAWDLRGREAWQRYGWSVLPALAAWTSLQWPVQTALRIQAGVLVVSVLVDRAFAYRRAQPEWLMPLRYALTAAGAASLVAASYA